MNLRSRLFDLFRTSSPLSVQEASRRLGVISPRIRAYVREPEFEPVGIRGRETIWRLSTRLENKMSQLAVNEIFGPTIQGEGPSIGHQAIFLRLSGCNLTCRRCDTPYTWAFSPQKAALHESGKMYDVRAESSFLETDQIASRLNARGLSHDRKLIVSGGEPLLQSSGLNRLIAHLDQFYASWTGSIEIETNGTQSPDLASTNREIRYNVSPKLSLFGEGMSRDRRLPFETLHLFARLAARREAIFKFVVISKTDLLEVEEFQTQFEVPNSSIYIMPEGVDRQEIQVRQTMLAQDVIDRGWNLTTRLHISLWGQRRGV